MAVLRDEKGRVLPGSKLNPSGRRTVDPAVLKRLETLTPKALDVLEQALDTSPSKQAFRAAEVIVSYTVPKMPQEIDLGGENPLVAIYGGIDAPRSESKADWEARKAREDAENALLNGHNGSTPRE